MTISFFSTQPYDKLFFEESEAAAGCSLRFFEVALTPDTTSLAENSEAVCVFVNDKLDENVISKLAGKGVKVIALRCAGFNNVDLAAAKKYNIQVCRVPAYSPHAVAEHAVGLMLTLNRKIHKAYNRVREQNFSLNGLLGFDFYGKTVGVIGTGNIGQAFCKIMLGFGCKVKAFDVIANRDMEAIGVEYHPLIDILQEADIISLHCPLNEQTHHLVNKETLKMMKKGCMLINTSRGGLIDTPAVINALKTGHLGYLGIDVYEQEEKLFFRDLSSNIIQDDVLTRLSGFPNVLITAHQGFFTHEALTQIALITLQNVKDLLKDGNLSNPGTLLTV